MSSYTRRDFLSTASAASCALLLSEQNAFTKPSRDDGEGPGNELTLWYEKPAAQWVDALPIGNGRLGAMVFGGGEEGDPGSELLQLNEDTCWSGQPRDGNNRMRRNIFLKCAAPFWSSRIIISRIRFARRCKGALRKRINRSGICG